VSKRSIKREIEQVVTEQIAIRILRGGRERVENNHLFPHRITEEERELRYAIAVADTYGKEEEVAELKHLLEQQRQIDVARYLAETRKG
jgi:hypothetical protein